MNEERLPIVVYSHLRWDSVFQRPQQIMSRISSGRRVLFIEEPLPCEGEEGWTITHPLPGLQIFQPHTRFGSGGFHAAQIPTLVEWCRSLLAREGIDRHVAWLYTPLAVPLARALEPDLVAYDCMDELTGFLHAPPELSDREAELLAWADLAFMGGRSLYRAKRARNAHVYCLPSSVDAAHFSKARSGLDEPVEQRSLARPRLGFFGVIDERLDLELLSQIAAARPAWQFVMVGPVVKIDPRTLPRRPNIHYMGRRCYQELPAFLAGWDVCLLPFALNAATRFISPTKTLEYMAAGRPIVSTPITDVVDSYGDVVYIADTAAAFVAACELALSADGAQETRSTRMREVLAQTSWDATAATMERKLEVAARRRRGRPRRPVAPPLRPRVELIDLARCLEEPS